VSSQPAAPVPISAALPLPSVSVIVPAYNESDVIVASLTRLVEHMDAVSDRFRWEIVVVNDGSTDGTGDLADAFASEHPAVRVLHHRVNFHLGQALRYAFNSTRSDYIAVIDCDLSYSPDHITRMLFAMQDSGARVVIASPYAKGGKTTAVPFGRRVMSRSANRMLSFAAGGGITTLTGMVRVYDGPFLRSLDLRAVDADINTEIVYKARILHARIIEIPAHLDWTFPETHGKRRPSADLRVTRRTFSSVFSSFLFRPFWFFVVPGLVLLAIAAYGFGWVVWHIAQVWGDKGTFGNSGFTAAVENAYRQAPHTFILTGITLVLALQLISLGVIAAQGKRYFEELFHLGSAVYRRVGGRAEPASGDEELHER
jgi:glycosyltransferase involved in cell wall biosynthesis